MTDTVLQSLRDRLLDESEPLAGLLRKCLMLGAVTGSDALREWARRELHGYQDEDEVPDYRKLSGPPIMMDTMSGYTWMKNRVVDRLNLPERAQEYVKDYLLCRQPVEELEQLAASKSLTMQTPALAYAEMLWNSELGAFQQVVNLRYAMTGSVISGVLGQIRTRLVDIVADLTAGTPLTELPSSSRVNDVMRERLGHVGDVYNTNINQPTGPTAIGREATSKTEGVTLAEVVALVAEIQRTVAAATPGPERDEAEDALVDLREVVEQDEPDTGEVIKRTGRLRAAIGRLGDAGATAATSRVAETLTDMAMNGQFF